MASTEAANHRARLANLWQGIARRSPALARCAHFDPAPEVPIERIAGLARARGEILTHAAAITHPEVYARWGTMAAEGLLLIGARGSGKSTLAHALATRLGSPLLEIDVPRLVLELLTGGGEIGALVATWDELFAEFPLMTVHFNELDFERVHETGERQAGLPVGPILEFLLRLISQTAASRSIVLVGSTSYPETVRPVFLSRRRFARTLAVQPEFPDDHAAVLATHAALARERAGRELFAPMDWYELVQAHEELSPGHWVEALHGALRAQARREAGGESVGLLTAPAILEEAAALVATATVTRAQPATGTYL